MLASADVGLAWVQQTHGVSVTLDAADNAYTVDHEQALGAEMTLTKRDANGQLVWVAPDNAILISGKSITGSLMGCAKINLNNGRPIWSYPGVYSLTAGDSTHDADGNTHLVHGEYVAEGGTVIKSARTSRRNINLHRSPRRCTPCRWYGRKTWNPTRSRAGAGFAKGWPKTAKSVSPIPRCATAASHRPAALMATNGTSPRISTSR